MIMKSPASHLAPQCVLLCFIKPLLGNRYCQSQNLPEENRSEGGEMETMQAPRTRVSTKVNFLCTLFVPKAMSKWAISVAAAKSVCERFAQQRCYSARTLVRMPKKHIFLATFATVATAATVAVPAAKCEEQAQDKEISAKKRDNSHEGIRARNPMWPGIERHTQAHTCTQSVRKQRQKDRAKKRLQGRRWTKEIAYTI